METPVMLEATEQASQACLMCKKRKRRCDKILPQCSFCAGKNWKCEYASASPLSTEGRLHENFEHFARSFPSVFFLDNGIFQEILMNIPKPSTSIPLYISTLIGDDVQIRKVAVQFFDTIHTYLPIVSKKLFYGRLVSPLGERRADVALLCLSMKLVTWRAVGDDDNPVNEAYLAAKQHAVELEIAGTFSIQALQAGVLISLYELGHGIYPSAYMSIRNCASYGFALDLHSRQETYATRGLSWVELEERRRVWWSIIILERVVNIGSPGTQLSTSDPASDELLPADDVAWDEGIIAPSYQINQLSDSEIEMGRFARLALSVHLLSRVFQHLNHNFSDIFAKEQEMIQLDRTLRALAVVCAQEGLRHHMKYCSVAICCSALMLLHAKYLRSENGQPGRRQLQERVWSIVKELAKLPVEAASAFLDPRSDLEEISPMVMHASYAAASVYIQVLREEPSEGSLQDLTILKDAMRKKYEKWKAAKSYLEILEAREVMNTSW